jgi:hypothetical protein
MDFEKWYGNNMKKFGHGLVLTNGKKCITRKKGLIERSNI